MNKEPKQVGDFLRCQNGLGAHRACLDSARQVFLSLKILASKAIEPSGLQLLQIIVVKIQLHSLLLVKQTCK